MSKDNRKLVLLDAHAIIHRAYHALPEFLSSSGEPTGALYGLSSMLMKIVTDLKPDYIVACYDLPQKTFRHEAYEKYKAGRAKTDDALILQLEKSRQIFEAFDVPIYDAPGFEADDILGTIVEQTKSARDLDIIIASGDMDTMQLVNDKKVQVYTLKKGINDTILYDEKKVIDRFGFKPKFLPDFKGLRGDPSDNIIGIKGIGEKIATNLVINFGTIEEIYKKLKKDEEAFIKSGISPRVLELMRNNEEEALFSKTLAKIRNDAPIKFSLPERTFWQKADLKKIENVFAMFEFRSLFARLKGFFGNNQKLNLAEFARVLGSPAQNSLEERAQPDQLANSLNSISETELQETSIALWLLNSDITSPTLDDILLFGKTSSFETAREYIFKQLKEKKLDKVYEEIEKPIISIVKKMQDHGILIDKKYFENLSVGYHQELDKLTAKIYKMAGMQFNINSPKQLSEAIFSKMGIKSGKKKNASGSFSTKVSVLEELEEDNPIIKEILSYRELQKLPIKTELGKKIRDGFVADKDYKLLAFDYSQIELRVAAMLSEDRKMTQIFREGKDIHAGVASFVFNVPMEKVDREMRRQAKVINFGIIYGMGVSSLRKSLGGTRPEAQKFYDNYFNQFSGIRDYLEKVKIFAMKYSYTETLFGRRRYFSNINSRIPFLKNMALRTAINAPIQGTATADIIKLAIRYTEEDLKKANLLDKIHLVLQIHDELVYEVQKDELSKAERIIKNAMQTVLERSYLHYKTDIPLTVHSRSGDNLGEVK